MDIKKIVLYLLTAALGVALWHAWMTDYPPAPVSAPATTQASNIASSTSSYVPPTDQADEASAPMARAEKTAPLVTVKTDVLTVQIDKQGNIIEATLPKYPVSLQEKNLPITILSNQPDQLYTTELGLTNLNDKKPLTFRSDQSSYTLSSDQQQLTVNLVATSQQGLRITKKYIFSRGDYSIKSSVTVDNLSGKPWAGSLFAQIVRKQPPAQPHSFFMMPIYSGAAISSPSTPYEKISFKTLDEKIIDRTVQGGWVAMQQHYFLTAWIPASQQQTNHIYSHTTVVDEQNQNNIYTIGFKSPVLTITAKNQASFDATLYVGPELTQQLSQLAPGLDHTVDYGWVWPISKLLFWILSNIENLIGNWGWSIILTTIVIKILFYGFSAKSFRSMARMRELQPRLQALKERCGDDRQAFSQATMELYRKEKVNPLGGCLPMLVQIPVFIALYYVLLESVELRQAPFMFWVQDLSTKDPYYVLPVLMGLSMLLQQRLTPVAPDPTQQKVMMVMPVIFTVFFLNFPSGLVLYWFVNNCVQVLQQWYVLKTYDKHKERIRSKKSKKKR